MPFQKGNKVGKQVQKGQVLNPNGRPRKFVTELKNMPEGYKASQVYDTLLVIAQLTEDELYVLANDMDATVLERTVANSIINGMRAGDLKAIGFLLERSIGKPKETIELDTTVAIKQTITLPDGSKLEL